jgi:hypothetical protein
LLPAPAKASEVGLGKHGVGEGTSALAPTSLMAGAEGVGDTNAAVGKPDMDVGSLRGRSLTDAGKREAAVEIDGGGGLGAKQERANTLPGVGELESVGHKLTMR